MTKQSTSPKGEMPESLRTFEAAGRSGGAKPKDQGLTAKPETAAKPDDPDRKDKAATDVLAAGVKKDPEAMTEVVQKSKDPRIP